MIAGAVLRFLSWYAHTYNVQNPTIDLLAQPDIGAKAQSYAEFLQAKELAWSSISNYLSSLIQCAWLKSDVPVVDFHA